MLVGMRGASGCRRTSTASSRAVSWWKRIMRSIPTRPESCSKRPDETNCMSSIA